ncbi:hypothetical protein [Curvibacter lanceolatus]|uniref:hypothetical protein n=1 Tax=Curvibacter lanceolatus TaxID=86182 RepID=UPI0003819A33|nr:hypothetical protein [Curvibacter lanceolatus]
MSEALHTPGPWPIEYDNSDGGQWYSVGPATIYFNYNRDPKEQEQAFADASLIATAPDLLMALTRIVKADDSAELTQEDIEFARAAIARATGKGE